jgi:hypothetical protein
MKPTTGHPLGLVGVVIYVIEGAEKTSFTREIFYGLEEEQIPYTIESGGLQSDDPVGMAYRAATRSVYGVGICSAHNGIVLHYSKLPKEKPLFVISKSRSNLNKARLLGLNAARLIKGTPFEEI